ncbi:hypothetical protein DFH07DRAFT_780368 [Mycena maculata]|uniref:Uncharacterized protein n=1 Tax=Mycena maculata TaxID=230809 RepID=A0AAD7MV59_9AGAR|nr:hypothetical protein DFH07DRAFT_780368 [Mycena maculata]
MICGVRSVIGPSHSGEKYKSFCVFRICTESHIRSSEPVFSIPNEEMVVLKRDVYFGVRPTNGPCVPICRPEYLGDRVQGTSSHRRLDKASMGVKLLPGSSIANSRSMCLIMGAMTEALSLFEQTSRVSTARPHTAPARPWARAAPPTGWRARPQAHRTLRCGRNWARACTGSRSARADDLHSHSRRRAPQLRLLTPVGAPVPMLGFELGIWLPLGGRGWSEEGQAKRECECEELLLSPEGISDGTTRRSRGTPPVVWCEGGPEAGRNRSLSGMAML